MYKNLIVLICLISLSLTGCAKKEVPAIDIGGIAISAQEFKDAFQASRYIHREDRAKEAFLESYISKRLILKEAELMGIDKDPQFLHDIQIYWEQGLLKLVLAQKSNEIIKTVKIDEKEIKEYFQAYQQSDFPGKELSAVSGQIEGILLREKQQKTMLAWIESLREKTDVKIDYPQLGINE
ncbi:MAG: hypothetical protein KAR05_07405 [Candidatus Omnitrophica bacterium]|nr:hypothetical protein [Candidatus Omnitrophota bacterium]